MYLLQVVLFILLPIVGSASFFLLAAICIVIVSCYGGGFGTMPAFNADYFGPANVGKIYGLMITAWGFGGVLGPILISRIIDTTGSYTAAFYIIAGILLVSSVLPFIVRPPKAPQETEGQAETARA
jgi:OFA family oxalate/formate antiporter-like MFS transporter